MNNNNNDKNQGIPWGEIPLRPLGRSLLLTSDDKTTQLVSVELLDIQGECFVPYDKVFLRIPKEPQGLGAIVEVDSHADSGWPDDENSNAGRRLIFTRVVLPSPGHTGMEREWSDGEENVSWTEAVGSGNVVKIISEGFLREELS